MFDWFFCKEGRHWHIHSFQELLISYSILKNNPIFVVSLRLWIPLKHPCLAAFLIVEIVLSYYGNTYSYLFTLFNIPTLLSPLFHKSRTKLGQSMKTLTPMNTSRIKKLSWKEVRKESFIFSRRLDMIPAFRYAVWSPKTVSET